MQNGLKCLGLALTITILTACGGKNEPTGQTPMADSRAAAALQTEKPAFAGLALAIPGITIGQDVNISLSAAGGTATGNRIEPATEVIIKTNPVNPKHLVVMANSGADFLYYSLDGGKNWRNVTMNDAGVFNGRGIIHTDPSLSFDDQGNLYAATGSLALHQMAICRFENGAFTGNPVKPSYCTLVAANDKWHIAAGPGSNVYASYEQNGVHLSYSTDSGRTFTAMRTSVGSAHNQSFSRPVADSNGNAYISWYDPLDRTIRVRSFTVNGAAGPSFGLEHTAVHGVATFLQMIPAQPLRGIYAGPVIDIDRSAGRYGGRLYVTYTDRGTHNGNDYDIFVVRSDDAGVTWLPAQSIGGKPGGSVNDDSGPASQFLPWLDVDRKTGTVSVLWYDTRDDPDNVKVRPYIATSVDGGRTFGPNRAVSDGQSDESNHGTHLTSDYDYAEYIGIAVDGCVAHTVWSDNSMTYAGAAGYFASNPNANDALILNGVHWTFVSGTAVGNQTKIGNNPDPLLAKSETIKNLVNDLNDSPDPKIRQARYFFSDFETFTIQAKEAGAAGGNFTVAAMQNALACIAGSCFVNFVDQKIDRLIIALNLKVDHVPLACTPGDRMIVRSGIKSPPAGSGKILRYDAKSGAFMNEFISNCLSVIPPSSVNCSLAPGASEDPVDMVFGPDSKLYVADQSIGGTPTTPSGLAVKRYSGNTGLFDDINDSHARFIAYGSGGLQQVGGLAFGADSNIYVSDYMTGAILRYHGQTGAFLNTPYVPAGTLHSPGKMLFGPDGNLYVLEEGGNRVVAFQGPFGVDPGKSMGDFVSANNNGGLSKPSAAVFDTDGRLYVASYLSDSVLRYQGPFDAQPGEFLDSFVPSKGGGLLRPTGLAFGPDGRLYVSSSNDAILGFHPQTKAFTGTLAYVFKPGSLLFSSVPQASLSMGDFYPAGHPDGCVGRADMTQLLNAISSKSTDKKYDLNGDGILDIADARKLSLLFTNKNGSCP